MTQKNDQKGLKMTKKGQKQTKKGPKRTKKGQIWSVSDTRTVLTVRECKKTKNDPKYKK